MRNGIKINYDNSLWILPDQIKSITATDEIDITKMTAPTLAVDITLKCEQDIDLTFELDKPCVVYMGNTRLFEMYVASSARGSDFEWKLSLCGALGHIDKFKYYGGIYGDPADYTSWTMSNADGTISYSEGTYYVPTIKTIAEVLNDIKKNTDIEIVCDNTNFPIVNETLHQVGMPICTARNALLYVNLIAGGLLRENGSRVTFEKFPTEVKKIPQSRILNDAKLSKVYLPNIDLHGYLYKYRPAGNIAKTKYDFNTGASYIEYFAFQCNFYDYLPNGSTVTGASNSNEIKVQPKTADENKIVEYDSPVATVNMYGPYWGNSGNAPRHPNYSPKDEDIHYSVAVPYKIDESVIHLSINPLSPEVSNVENRLISPAMAETLKNRIKEDFSYNRLAEINVVEGYEKVKYGEVKYGSAKYASLIAHNITDIGVKFEKTIYGQSKYGTVRYRGKGQGGINVGDKVEFEVRGKKITGFVTRTKYNLNGNIIIKNCEVVYREDETE